MIIRKKESLVHSYQKNSDRKTLEIVVSSSFTIRLTYLWMKTAVNTDWWKSLSLTIINKIISFCQSLFWIPLDVCIDTLFWFCIFMCQSKVLYTMWKISEPPLLEEYAFLLNHPTECLKKVTSALCTPFIVFTHSNRKRVRGWANWNSYSSMTCRQEWEFLAARSASFLASLP